MYMSLVGKLKERDHKEDYDVEEMIVPKVYLRETGYGVWMGLIWLSTGFLGTP
jgi:hypothetical protein